MFYDYTRLTELSTNVFGAMNVARAFLPYQREAKTGTIVWIGSGAGWISVAGASPQPRNNVYT